MNSKERVMAVFEHRLPDCVPIWCGMSDEFREKAMAQTGLDEEGLLLRLGDDFRRISAVFKGPAVEFKHPEATFRTPFGIERHGPGYGQPIDHPLAGATVKKLDEYPWPDPKWMDVSTLRQQAAKWKDEFAILGGDWSAFWHEAVEIVGVDEFYRRMSDEPEFVDTLLDRIVEYYLSVNRRIFEEAGDVIDIFFMGNDFGSQVGPPLNLDMFKRFLLPRQKKLIDLAKEFGLKTQLHCEGGFESMIPLLIEAGLDSLHSVQPTYFGISITQLKHKYGWQIVFNGSVDSHLVLIDGDLNLVRDEIKRVLDVMMPGGCYIGGTSHETVLQEAPVENVLALFDAIKEFGRY